MWAATGWRACFQPSCPSTTDLLWHKYWGCLFFGGSPELEKGEPRVPSRKPGRRGISKLVACDFFKAQTECQMGLGHARAWQNFTLSSLYLPRSAVVSLSKIFKMLLTGRVLNVLHG